MLGTTTLFEEFIYDTSDHSVYESFNSLENDKYIKGNFPFRKRAFCTGLLSQNSIVWDSTSEFFQDTAHNNYAGNIVRRFAIAGKVIRDHVGLLLLSPMHHRFFGDSSWIIGLHQIRIVCDTNNSGYPAPEGSHQDGFDFVITYCVNQSNITGGETSLRLGATDGPIVLCRSLQKGEAIIVNDKSLFHYTTPINVASEADGFRDMCIITLNTATSVLGR